MNGTNKRSTRTAAALAVGLGVAGALAGVLAGASPAAAQIVETDRPKVTESHFDFGRNWTVGAPRNGGFLDWDLVDGVMTPRLSGYLYLSDRECGRVKVEYFDNDEGEHDFLANDFSAVHCAPGNGKTQWWVVLDDYDSTLVDHVHVDVQRRNASGSFSDVGSGDFEDYH